MMRSDKAAAGVGSDSRRLYSGACQRSSRLHATITLYVDGDPVGELLHDPNVFGVVTTVGVSGLIDGAYGALRVEICSCAPLSDESENRG